VARAQVKNGKGSMPAWADSLSPSDIQDVAAYVYNQAANDLW
jgi:mono/diheme cytochrome c family protein